MVYCLPFLSLPVVQLVPHFQKMCIQGYSNDLCEIQKNVFPRKMNPSTKKVTQSIILYVRANLSMYSFDIVIIPCFKSKVHVRSPYFWSLK